MAVIIAIVALAMPQIIGKSKRLLSYFPVLGWIEIGAESFVAIGCFAEFILLFLKEPEEHDNERKIIRRNWERVWMSMVAIGVAAGIPCLMIGLRESAQLNEEAGNARRDAGEAIKQAGEASERAANIESNNLALRATVAKLEAKNRWRTISPEQKDAFIASTKEVLKFPIRVRMGANANAEAQSFALRIRELLDAAGFVETNKELALTRWPQEMDMLWTGIGSDMPPILFLNNIVPTSKPADLQKAQAKLKTYPAYSTNTVVQTEFILVNDDADSEAYVTESNGVPILHVKFPDRSPFRMSAFLGVQSAFSGIGVESQWATVTNIPSGICEIFVNPK